MILVFRINFFEVVVFDCWEFGLFKEEFVGILMVVFCSKIYCVKIEVEIKNKIFVLGNVDYIDFKRSLLYVKVSIIYGDGIFF